MPELSVNVEIYCATCGEGLCNQTEFTQTRYRCEPSFRVEVCPVCIGKKNDEIEDLEQRIAELLKELEEE